MKNHKKPPKPKPAPAKPPPQPKPAAAARHAEPKTLDSCRVDYLERRVDLICDDLKQIFYALGQIEERLGQSLRRLDLDRAPEIAARDERPA
jgi:hypothetical protein